MNKTIFTDGEYILNENREKQYVLLEPAKYNDKYYVVHAMELTSKRDCLLKFVECEDDSYKLNNLTREGDFCFYYPYIEQVYGNFNGYAPNGDKIFGVELEFIHGKNLKDYRKDLEKQIVFDEMEESEAEWLIYRQMLQFLYGMRYYTEFAKQIYLHRDIKPENVMINEQGEVVIVDFDFAHIAGSDRTINIAGWDVAFSRGYSSPDVFSTRKNMEWDISTDVYSAGRLFFFWLNGQSYFTEEQMEVGQTGHPASTKYCVEKNLGYGITTNKNRFKKKYLKEEYQDLLTILDKMCCNPDTHQTYKRVSHIISDFEAFLLKLCKDSVGLLEDKLDKKNWRVLQGKKQDDGRKYVMVIYRQPDGLKLGKPLYENTMRDIIYEDEFLFTIINFANQITYIPTLGRDIRVQKRKDTDTYENANSYEIKDGDVVICDGIALEFTVV